MNSRMMNSTAVLGWTAIEILAGLVAIAASWPLSKVRVCIILLAGSLGMFAYYKRRTLSGI